MTAAVGAVGLLRRLVKMIRHSLPGVQIRVRLDGGFAHPAMLEFLDAQPRLEDVYKRQVKWRMLRVWRILRAIHLKVRDCGLQ